MKKSSANARGRHAVKVHVTAIGKLPVSSDGPLARLLETGSSATQSTVAPSGPNSAAAPARSRAKASTSPIPADLLQKHYQRTALHRLGIKFDQAIQIEVVRRTIEAAARAEIERGTSQLQAG